MLLAPTTSAPGPLYAIVHAIFAPITNLRAPGVRWVNVVFLAWTVGATFTILSQLRRCNALFTSCLLIGVPVSWVIGGMALTEAPAAAMAASALSCLIFAQSSHGWNRPLSIAVFAASGAFAALAFLGRQIYLPILLMYVAVAVADKKARVGSAVALSSFSLLVAPVFITWGGILAPRWGATLLYHGRSIAISHGVLSFAYIGAIVLLLAPSFYGQQLLGTIAVFMLAAALNAAIFGLEVLPFMSVLAAFPTIQLSAGWLIGSIMVGLAFAFVFSFTLAARTYRHDFWSSVIALLAVVLAATPFAIVHLFSSRYAFAAIPFILLLLSPFFGSSLWLSVRVLLGAALGTVSLYSYFWRLT